MKSCYEGKKLLILGGAYLHKKVVEAANEMGIYTIVTDNVPDSPAKKIASKYYDINVSDVEDIVAMCKKEQVSAVLNVCLDFCQIYYQQICEKIGLPCYGTYEQFQIFTNKELFKNVCIENGVDIIPTYAEHFFEEMSEDSVFPVLVKPAHNRGSRGQRVCYTCEQTKQAVAEAKKMSDDGHAIIEKYMGDKDDFQVTYLVIDGEPYVVRTADRYLGPENEDMNRVAIALSSPSRNTDFYLKKVHKKVGNMLKKLGIKNAPVFMQGFRDGDTVRFYDPGLRFPGGDYDRIFSDVMNINMMKMLIELAFTGRFADDSGNENRIDEHSVYLNDNIIFTLHSTVRAGKIKEITPIETLLDIDGVDYVSFRHKEGETIEFTGTVNQRIAEVNIHGKTQNDIKRTVKTVEELLAVLDENGKNMIFCKFDIDNWR